MKRAPMGPDRVPRWSHPDRFLPRGKGRGFTLELSCMVLGRTCAQRKGAHEEWAKQHGS
jgi:hypothetical protein